MLHTLYQCFSFWLTSDCQKSTVYLSRFNVILQIWPCVISATSQQISEIHFQPKKKAIGFFRALLIPVSATISLPKILGVWGKPEYCTCISRVNLNMTPAPLSTTSSCNDCVSFSLSRVWLSFPLQCSSTNLSASPSSSGFHSMWKLHVSCAGVVMKRFQAVKKYFCTFYADIMKCTNKQHMYTKETWLVFSHPYQLNSLNSYLHFLILGQVDLHSSYGCWSLVIKVIIRVSICRSKSPQCRTSWLVINPLWCGRYHWWVLFCLVLTVHSLILHGLH